MEGIGPQAQKVRARRVLPEVRGREVHTHVRLRRRRGEVTRRRRREVAQVAQAITTSADAPLPGARTKARGFGRRLLPDPFWRQEAFRTCGQQSRRPQSGGPRAVRRCRRSCSASRSRCCHRRSSASLVEEGCTFRARVRSADLFTPRDVVGPAPKLDSAGT